MLNNYPGPFMFARVVYFWSINEIPPVIRLVFSCLYLFSYFVVRHNFVSFHYTVIRQQILFCNYCKLLFPMVSAVGFRIQMVLVWSSNQLQRVVTRCINIWILQIFDITPFWGTPIWKGGGSSSTEHCWPSITKTLSFPFKWYLLGKN